jgi:hypothetical protein
MSDIPSIILSWSRSLYTATTSDMEDFVKPLTSLILHTGTNDLRRLQLNLVTHVKEDSPNTAIDVSAILVRSDDNDFS